MTISALYTSTVQPTVSFPRKREPPFGQMGKSYFVYIMASRKYGALYVGVTSDLIGRVYLHREAIVAGHTSRYQIHNLVCFELHEAPDSAIQCEKRIKKWRRSWKIELIERYNPHWRDLYPEVISSS